MFSQALQLVINNGRALGGNPAHGGVRNGRVVGTGYIVVPTFYTQ